ncbi:Calcium-dependent protein kinase 15 [Asimina triloba]
MGCLCDWCLSCCSSSKTPDTAKSEPETMPKTPDRKSPELPQPMPKTPDRKSPELPQSMLKTPVMDRASPERQPMPKTPERALPEPQPIPKFPDRSSPDPQHKPKPPGKPLPEQQPKTKIPNRLSSERTNRPVKLPSPPSTAKPAQARPDALEPPPFNLPPSKPPQTVPTTKTVKLIDSELNGSKQRSPARATSPVELGRGMYGITYLCTEKSTGVQYACKSVFKWKLRNANDKENIGREVQILKHLKGNPNIVEFKEVYEDMQSEIIDGGHYSESTTAKVFRKAVSVVDACHGKGVMHVDLKSEDFLFASKDDEGASLKLTDFKLSILIEEGVHPLRDDNLSEEEIKHREIMFEDMDHNRFITRDELDRAIDEYGMGDESTIKEKLAEVEMDGVGYTLLRSLKISFSKALSTVTYHLFMMQYDRIKYEEIFSMLSIGSKKPT